MDRQALVFTLLSKAGHQGPWPESLVVVHIGCHLPHLGFLCRQYSLQVLAGLLSVHNM